jgi:hypothetical protein
MCRRRRLWFWASGSECHHVIIIIIIIISSIIIIRICTASIRRIDAMVLYLEDSKNEHQQDEIHFKSTMVPFTTRSTTTHFVSGTAAASTHFTAVISSIISRGSCIVVQDGRSTRIQSVLSQCCLIFFRIGHHVVGTFRIELSATLNAVATSSTVSPSTSFQPCHCFATLFTTRSPGTCTPAAASSYKHG